MPMCVRRVGCALAGAAAMLVAAAPARAAECNPLSVGTCLAPFPSDYWADKDPASPTGMRANVSDDLLRPGILRQLPVEDGVSPSGIFNGATGFSAGVGAVFEFTERQAPFPPGGGDDIVAYDLDAGARVPVHAFISGHARNPVHVGLRQTNVIQVFPRTRWTYRHRIVIAIGTRFGVGDPAFTETAARLEPGSKAAAYAAELEEALRAAGVDPSTTRTATLFTVRDRAEVLEPTDRLMRDTMSRPHPVRDVRVSWSAATLHSAGLVLGEVRLDNYRTRGGVGPVDFSGATRSDEWVKFRLTLPRSAARRPAGVAIYAHGLANQKESDYNVTEANASVGWATMAIDWPNHGSRAVANGGGLFSLLRPKRLGIVSGLANQATPDMAGLYAAIEQLDVDVLRRPTWRDWHGRGPDGRNDIDPTAIGMQGTSLGGVLGANFAARAPKLDFVAFQVAGTGISHAAAQTILWNGLAFAFPDGTNGTEDAIFMGALQQVADPADGINTIEWARWPRPGQETKPVLLLTGKDDAILPNPVSTAMANLLDLPLVGPERYDMPGVRRAAEPDPDGYAVRQYPPLIGRLPIPQGSGTTAHLISLWPDAQTAMASFVRRHSAR